MKTVIVIDTEDPIGMESTRRVVDYLMKTHHTIPYDRNDPFGGKIQAIKTMRGFVRWCKEQYGEEWIEEIGSLRASKHYIETFGKFSRSEVI
tara:strand:- start:8035 stop:8310 length:276 start_codon:yes stop_codon:yes gene_type:complete